jgi:hypothetical protein
MSRKLKIIMYNVQDYIRLFTRLYVRVGILLTCGKNDRIISLRGDALVP